MFGQTLFDHANYLSIEASSLAPMFAVRAFGYSVGSVASGVLFDRFHYLSFWQLIVIIATGSIGESNNLVLQSFSSEKKIDSCRILKFSVPLA